MTLKSSIDIQTSSSGSALTLEEYQAMLSGHSPSPAESFAQQGEHLKGDGYLSTFVDHCKESGAEYQGGLP